MMPSYFEFHCPVKIVSGFKALENLPYELKRLGASRPLLITDLGVSLAGLLHAVTAALQDSEVLMVGIVHALGHAAGALCRIHHGTAMNIFLPHGLEYNLGKRRQAIGEPLLPLAGSEVYAETPAAVRAEKIIETLRRFQDEVQKLSGLPTRLRDADVPQSMLESIARTALDDGVLLFNSEDMTFEEALYVLHKA